MATLLDDKTALGKAILRRLYLMGKNQAWLSKETGITRSYISNICKKPVNLKVDTALRISKALGVGLEELLEEAEKQQNELFR